jgi:prepilin-type N-terminal cleavage/methylation domain-containing protein
MKRVGKGKDRVSCAGSKRMTTNYWLLTLGAFTLIELLVVISVIAILASLVFPVTGAVNAAKIKNRAKTELAEIETAIQRYQTKLGHYPPDNPGNPATNQLFYELMGTTNTGTTYITLDGSTSIPVTAVSAAFGPRIGGFVNSTRGSSGDEASSATKFLTALKPNQLAKSPSGAAVLVGVPWQQGPPPFNFDPFGPTAPGINPWRYNSSSPTNNPNSYDLWIEVRVGSKTFLICNWSKQPLPLTVHDPY